MTYEASLSHIGQIRNNWGWFLALGIIFIIGGAIAIAEPLLSGVFVAAIVGITIAIVGVMQIVQAWQMGSWGGFALQLIIGIVLLVGGLDIWWDPIEGLMTLTLFVALMFIIKGIFQIMLGFQMRPHDGWVWIIAAGVIALAAGVLIFIHWPSASLFVLGTLAGISLIFTGWSYVMIALAARRVG
jgi:uncharacterized membrane protein HdeD (DUF308 family)